MDSPESLGIISSLLDKASPAASERYGRFTTHLFVSSKNMTLLSAVWLCLNHSQGTHGDRLRQSVFEEPAFRAGLLPGSLVDHKAIDPLVDTLRSVKDGVLAVGYTHDLVETLKGDKKGKNLDKVSCPDLLEDINSPYRSFHSCTPGRGFSGKLKLKKL